MSTPGGLRYSINEDGVVAVTQIGKPGMMLKISTAQAKRFAYAMLLDLDPKKLAGAHEDEPAPEPRIWVSAKTLAALCALKKRGPSTAKQLSPHADQDIDTLRVRLHKMRKRGLVEAVSQGERWAPFTYSLTKLGRRACE